MDTTPPPKREENGQIRPWRSSLFNLSQSHLTLTHGASNQVCHMQMTPWVLPSASALSKLQTLFFAYLLNISTYTSQWHLRVRYTKPGSLHLSQVWLISLWGLLTAIL